jgi:hypothetical protein
MVPGHNVFFLCVKLVIGKVTLSCARMMVASIPSDPLFSYAALVASSEPSAITLSFLMNVQFTSMCDLGGNVFPFVT